MVQLAEAIRAALTAAGDPARAEAQRAYLKSELPCHGIANGEVRSLVGGLLPGTELGPAEWESLIRELWDSATHREERFAALSVARARTFRRYAESPDALELYAYRSAAGRGGTWSTRPRTWSSRC